MTLSLTHHEALGNHLRAIREHLADIAHVLEGAVDHDGDPLSPAIQPLAREAEHLEEVLGLVLSEDFPDVDRGTVYGLSRTGP